MYIYIYTHKYVYIYIVYTLYSLNPQKLKKQIDIHTFQLKRWLIYLLAITSLEVYKPCVLAKT